MYFQSLLIALFFFFGIALLPVLTACPENQSEP
jgi:hypothetical protein